jgi:hypothetical protein
MSEILDSIHYRDKLFKSGVKFLGKHIVVPEFRYIYDMGAWSSIGSSPMWRLDGEQRFISTNHGHNTDSQMEIPLSGVHGIEFDWGVSSEGGFDYINIYINGERVVRKAGSYSAHYSKTFDEKTDIILRVDYHKDGSVSRGSDIGWIENIVLN